MPGAIQSPLNTVIEDSSCICLHGKGNAIGDDRGLIAAQLATADDIFIRPIVDTFLKRFSLSKRETQAAVFVAIGLRAKQIAQRMSCSEKTVYAHLARVCKKTGCRDYHEVVCTLLAFACHLLGHSPSDHRTLVAPKRPGRGRRSAR